MRFWLADIVSLENPELSNLFMRFNKIYAMLLHSIHLSNLFMRFYPLVLLDLLVNDLSNLFMRFFYADVRYAR